MLRALVPTLVCLPSLAFSRQVEDPRPPRVNELEALPAPEARAFDELTTHAAPRPLPEGARVEDWPTFLGPRRDGTSTETGLRVSWGEEGPPLLWEVRIGQGYSQPAVAGGRVVVQHREGQQSHIDCLDAETGRRYWRHTYPCEYRGQYISDGGPRATPAIANGWVYTHTVEGRLKCLELSTGRVRWERDLRAEFGLSDNFFGVVASPLVDGDALFINVGRPGPSAARFDTSTGRLVWGTGEQWGASCASPVLGTVHGRPRLLVMTGGESRPPTGGLMVLDPASGALDFSYPFRSRIPESVNAACPLVIGDDVYLSASYGMGSAVLALEPDGGFQERWRNFRSLGLQFSNPVELEGKIYALDGKSDRVAELVCLDPKSGKELSRTALAWEERVFYRDSQRDVDFSVGEGSLLVVDGKLLCLGDQGHLLWIEASPEGARILSRASLFRARESWTPPALSHGLVFVRQTLREGLGRDPRGRRVLCFDLRGE